MKRFFISALTVAFCVALLIFALKVLSGIISLILSALPVIAIGFLIYYLSKSNKNGGGGSDLQ